MKLFGTLYCSRSTRPQNYASLTEILKVAQDRNELVGITGLLCYSDPHFFQYLEGPQVALHRLMERIYRDERHTEFILLDARTISKRAFPEWTMRLVVPRTLPGGLFREIYDESAGQFGATTRPAERLMSLMKSMANESPSAERS